jgi:exodeoxyribonuclease VII small subunit
MKKTPSKSNITKFEDSLAQLKRLVEELESGDNSLEASLKAFEEGIKLTRDAQKTIAEAEQTVLLLVEQNGHPALEKFDDKEIE